MMKKSFLIFITTILLTGFVSCNKKGVSTLEVSYLREGKLTKENISLDFIQNGRIISDYIDTVRFSLLDSLSFYDGEKYEVYSTPVTLDFTQKIEPYSPEYYTAYTLYHILRAINYYNDLFDNKIDFNSQDDSYDNNYREIEITLGDAPYITTPNTYILIPNSHPSPSLFYHEIGHRAFWYIQSEEGLNIKFNGLSLIHMGFLEYYTVSLNNSPLVGEDALIGKMSRDADLLWRYPPADSLGLGRLIEILAETYSEDLLNPNKNATKFYNSIKDVPAHITDNHRGGMILASTLWRIRQQIGQADCDKLVTQTILSLNEYMDMRDLFYASDKDEKVSTRVEWYDAFYGLVAKDKELFAGKAKDIIIQEFRKTGYPVERVTFN